MWRSFAAEFGRGEALLRKHFAETRSSHDTYLVSERSDLCIALRDDALYATTLAAVHANGLECWDPLFTARFPLAQRAVDELFALWQLAAPRCASIPLSLRNFSQMMESVAGHVRPVAVCRVFATPAACVDAQSNSPSSSSTAALFALLPSKASTPHTSSAPCSC